MRKFLITVNVALLIGISIVSKAQVDPHFTQYYMYPLWLNPALTGTMDGDYRVNANYRSQWDGLGDFSTVALSGDMTTDKNINIGANILNQKAGDAGYNYFTGYASVAYTGVKFGSNGDQHINFGLQAGWIQRQVDPNKFQYYDSSLRETLSSNSGGYFDFGAGVLYYDAAMNKKANWYGGFSVGHINKPTDQFVKKSTENYVVPYRFTVHGGVRINISETFNLVPNALWMKQGSATETMLGIYGELKANETTDVLFGANCRFNDALAPFVGFYYNNFTVGLSYDVNSTSLGQYAGSKANSFELSMSYLMKRKRTFDPGYFKCPRI